MYKLQFWFKEDLKKNFLGGIVEDLGLYEGVLLQVVKMLLKLLEDKNGEVQNLAVKWWVHPPQ